MTKRRVARTLHARLDRRLSMYAMAAATAAMLTPPARAAIVYTSAKKFGEGQLGVEAIIPIDLNHDGTTDFSLVGVLKSVFDSVVPIHTASVDVGAYNGSVAVSGTLFLQPIAAALQLGQKIGPVLEFQHPNDLVLAGSLATSHGYGVTGGNFLNQINRFLALKFQVNNATYYGWARVNIRRVLAKGVTGRNLVFELVDYAYEDRANTPLRAGEGIPQADATVLQSGGEQTESASAFPASLGLLAYGSDSIPAWRR